MPQPSVEKESALTEMERVEIGLKYNLTHYGSGRVVEGSADDKQYTAARFLPFREIV